MTQPRLGQPRLDQLSTGTRIFIVGRPFDQGRVTSVHRFGNRWSVFAQLDRRPDVETVLSLRNVRLVPIRPTQEVLP